MELFSIFLKFTIWLGQLTSISCHRAGSPEDQRLIFIDLNAPPAFDNQGKPDWLEPAMTRLERYEQKELKEAITAYVFVTNMAFHGHLHQRPTMAAAPFGLGHPDFNRPGLIRVTDA